MAGYWPPLTVVSGAMGWIFANGSFAFHFQVGGVPWPINPSSPPLGTKPLPLPAYETGEDSELNHCLCSTASCGDQGYHGGVQAETAAKKKASQGHDGHTHGAPWYAMVQRIDGEDNQAH